MAGTGRRASTSGHRRPADARRPQVSVARATSRPERRLRDSAAGARVDPRRDRLAEAAPGAAEHPRDPGAGRLQLRARAERILGGARRPRGGAARAPAGGRGRLSGPRRLSGVRLVAAARERGPRDRRRPAPVGAVARLRRPRRDDRAPRHRRRLSAPVPPRADSGRDQPRRPRGAQRRVRGRGPGRPEPPGAARHRDGGPARGRRRPWRYLGRGDRRFGAADPGRGLAARPDRQLGRVRA